MNVKDAGRKGGQSRSEKKLSASKENIKKALAARLLKASQKKPLIEAKNKNHD